MQMVSGALGSLVEGLGFRVYRNCIGFGSGVLGGFAGFLLLLLFSGLWAPGCGLAGSGLHWAGLWALRAG